MNYNTEHDVPLKTSAEALNDVSGTAHTADSTSAGPQSFRGRIYGRRSQQSRCRGRR